MIDFLNRNYTKDEVIKYIKSLSSSSVLTTNEKLSLEYILERQEIDENIVNFCREYLDEDDIQIDLYRNFRYKPSRLSLMNNLEDCGFHLDRVNETLELYLSKHELTSIINESTLSNNRFIYIHAQSRFSRLNFIKNLNDNNKKSVYLNNESLKRLTYYRIPLSIIISIYNASNKYDVFGKQILVNPVEMIINMKSVPEQKNFWRWIE